MRALASAFGVALGLLWVIVWWAGAVNNCATCSRWKVLLNFNALGEGVVEGVVLHLVLVFLIVLFIREARQRV